LRLFRPLIHLPLAMHDFRVTSSTDEWVCADPDMLTTVISPAVRMALKLHQDHFAAGDDFEEIAVQHERIQHYENRIFISHEVKQRKDEHVTTFIHSFSTTQNGDKQS
jgi:hypothetical protein